MPSHVVEALVDLRRRGRRVAALVVDTTDLLPTDPELALARRFWALELTAGSGCWGEPAS